MTLVPRIYRKIRFKAGHGVHSPFVFKLITHVINEKADYYFYRELEKATEEQVCNKQQVPYYIHGVFLGNKAIKEIARKHCPQKKNRLLFRLANYFQCTNQLHLGSDLGLATLALSGFSTSCRVDLIEEDANIRSFIKDQEHAAYSNPPFLLNEYPASHKSYDLIYVSQLNRGASAEYVTQNIQTLLLKDSLLIIDGIHTSRAGSLLWKKLIEKEDSIISVDLYHLGLIFLKPSMPSKHYHAYL